MSVETIHVQPTIIEELHTEAPPITLQRLTEVPPPPAYAPPPAPELLPPPGLAPPTPGLSSPLGLHQPTEVKEVTPEMKELLNNVSLELTKIADNFASSEFMTHDKNFEFEYGSIMLPPGLEGGVGMYPPGLYEDESDTQSIPAKLDGNESSDESTKADSCADESGKADSTPEEDESNDEVPELPDLSPEGLSTRKKEKIKAKRMADDMVNTTQATTRIVFGDQGAKLAAQAAMLATNGCDYADITPWHLPYGASAFNWHPYYGYAAW